MEKTGKLILITVLLLALTGIVQAQSRVSVLYTGDPYPGHTPYIHMKVEPMLSVTPIQASRDHYAGISDSDKERIFTRFERLDKESVKGTGLGLAIAQRVVDLHGGRIWVEDNPEGGCIFYVSLAKESPVAAP